jgi:hypothetical protein
MQMEPPTSQPLIPVASVRDLGPGLNSVCFGVCAACVCWRAASRKSDDFVGLFVVVAVV